MRLLPIFTLFAAPVLLVGCNAPPVTETPHNADASDKAAPPQIDEHPASSTPGAAPDNSQVEPRHPAARNNEIRPDH